MKVFSLFLFILFAVSFNNSLYAQGCVAIRGFSGCTGNTGHGANLLKGEFLLGTNVRYFKSFRHFRGREEEHYRQEEGTEVINNSYFFDILLTYGISNRWYINTILPFLYHNRSSMYEHGGNPPNGLGERHETNSYGLSDIRIGTGYWLFDPEKHTRFNTALGIGLKLPTGRYNYIDTFFNQGPNRDQSYEAVVDQSIQPGDGGYGIALDFQGYIALSSHFLLSSNLFYLINPEETNGVRTRNGNSEFSVPDQFAATLGTFYMTPVHGLVAYLGGRLEGIPATDLLGGSAGYRRPGYVVSIEPGINYTFNKASLSLNVPIALERNRIQSYEDKVRTRETGNFVQGDAAFADYLINLSFTYRVGGKEKMPDFHILQEEEK